MIKLLVKIFAKFITKTRFDFKGSLCIVSYVDLFDAKKGVENE
jgi:hypothetical protein